MWYLLRNELCMEWTKDLCKKKVEYEVMSKSIRNGHRSQAGHRTTKINVLRVSISSEELLINSCINDGNGC